MPPTVAYIGQQMLASRTLLERRPVQLALGVLAGATVLSIGLAPDVEATGWDWTRLLLIALLGALAVLVFVGASGSPEGPHHRQAGLIGAAALVLIALILNLTFSLGTALVFSVGLTAITLVAVTDHDDRSVWAMTGALLVAVPSWTWSALEAWSWGLLMLGPLAAAGIVSDGHIRAAVALPETVTSPLTSRAHRLGSWLGVLGAALLALAAGLVTGAANGIVALGAVGAIVLAGVAFATPDQGGDGRRAIALVDLALLWIALCWIVSLQ